MHGEHELHGEHEEYDLPEHMHDLPNGNLHEYQEWLD